MSDDFGVDFVSAGGGGERVKHTRRSRAQYQFLKGIKKKNVCHANCGIKLSRKELNFNEVFFFFFLFDLSLAAGFICSLRRASSEMSPSQTKPILTAVCLRHVKSSLNPGECVRFFRMSEQKKKKKKSGPRRRRWPASTGFESARGPPLKVTSEKASRAGSSV